MCVGEIRGVSVLVKHIRILVFFSKVAEKVHKNKVILITKLKKVKVNYVVVAGSDGPTVKEQPRLDV